MCGITGILPWQGGEPPSQDQLEAMSAALVHRGPDDRGLDLTAGVGLAMRRLSIIDLETGQQPYFSEDRCVRVVFNGEIYNFRELRAQLEDRGHRFATETDGEVIVHLWEERGVDFLRPLNGMFAIALHDTRQRKVLIARDRLGIKPLFYSFTPRHFVFGSEIKALLASGLIPRDLDVDALGQFVSWEYVPAPQTLVRNVFKLEAATLLLLDLSTRSTQSMRWWDLPTGGRVADRGAGSGRTGIESEWLEKVDSQIEESVQRQLVSDVPLGAFLSGGVDSSIVVGKMGPARAFTIAFDDPSYNESAWARRVAEHLGVRHRVEILRPDIGDLFENLMEFMEDPIGDFSIFPTYLVSRLARDEVKVVLSGDGGDELFGGYETFLAHRAAEVWSGIPGPLRRRALEPAIRWLRPRPAKKGWINKARRFVEGLEHDSRLGHARWRVFAGTLMRRALFTPEAQARMDTPVEHHIVELASRFDGANELDRQLFVDLNSYLVDNCLVKVDRMSMACSLEVRVPLLDHELVELAFRVPARFKVRGWRSKYLLKRVAARHVPAACVYRPKEGFSVPIKSWLRGPLRPRLEELLDRRRIRQQGLLQPETVERLKQQHLSGEANHSHVLWSLMVFQDWMVRWGVE